MNQIDDLLEEIDKRVKNDDKVLVTTISPSGWPRSCPNISTAWGVRNRYIHSDVDTLERIQILEDLRAGMFDVLVGVNLLREGLDLPEVALVGDPRRRQGGDSCATCVRSRRSRDVRRVIHRAT